MVACFPRGKLLLFSVYVNSSHLTTRVEYFGIIGSRLIAECFAFIFHCNLTAADMKRFRVSAYRRINTVIILHTLRYGGGLPHEADGMLMENFELNS